MTKRRRRSNVTFIGDEGAFGQLQAFVLRGLRQVLLGLEERDVDAMQRGVGQIEAAMRAYDDEGEGTHVKG